MPSERRGGAAEVGGGRSAALPADAWIAPDWPAPAGVGALMSTRAGGVSTGVWSSLNLGRSVGDDAAAVAENRRRFVATLGARPVWLRQVHGTRVLRLDAATPEFPDTDADAAWTRERGVACIVGAADCLPVLFASPDGSTVAAAHAGWRGLAAGVLEAVVATLQRDGGVAPHSLVAWLGPCIGPRHFEVGDDVLAAFGAEPEPADAPFFRYVPRPDGSRRWLADLQALARQRLQRCGVTAVAADASCTYAEPSRFFSFRRDGRTGRMAAAVWRR